jgi:hypothetical protein
MPYIKKEQRLYFEPLLMILKHRTFADAGELNYMLTEVIQQYFANHPKNYQSMNDVVGALESCKTEFERRIVKPYEQSKITLNGDVYEGDILK